MEGSGLLVGGQAVAVVLGCAIGVEDVFVAALALGSLEPVGLTEAIGSAGLIAPAE